MFGVALLGTIYQVTFPVPFPVNVKFVDCPVVTQHAGDAEINPGAIGAHGIAGHPVGAIPTTVGHWSVASATPSPSLSVSK